MAPRLCSRSACQAPASATLTYSYADSTAVVGPLGDAAGGHHLCPRHAASLSVPRGWDVVVLPGAGDPPPVPDDDLLALADAIREVGLRHDEPETRPAAARASVDDRIVVLAERRHLRVIADNPNAG